MNVAAARLKGLLYLIALLALTAGIPFALYTFAGNPLAGITSLTLDTVKEALTTQDDGTLFLSALTIIAGSPGPPSPTRSSSNSLQHSAASKSDESKDSSSNNTRQQYSSAAHSY